MYTLKRKKVDHYAAGTAGKDRSGNGCKRFAVSFTGKGVNLSQQFYDLPSATYNAFSRQKRITRPGEDAGNWRQGVGNRVVTV